MNKAMAKEPPQNEQWLLTQEQVHPPTHFQLFPLIQLRYAASFITLLFQTWRFFPSFPNRITPHPHSLWSGQYVAPSKRSLKSPHSHRAALILFLGLRSSLNKMWTLVKKLWTEFRTANFKLHMAKHTVVFKNHQIIWYHISIESYHSRSKVRDKRQVSRWRNSPVGHWAATAFGDVYCNLKIWATSLISLHCWALQPCSAQQSLHME